MKGLWLGDLLNKQAESMGPHSKVYNREQRLFRISFDKLKTIVISLPLFATLFCVIWSYIFDFEASTATHCRVPNYLPSISSAIGGFTPQRYVWRICIGLHCSPRLMVAIAYYAYHTQVHVGKWNSVYNAIAALCSLLHIIENLSLVSLTYISSTENHSIHEISFIVFIVSSQVYMILTCVVYRWGRISGGRHTETEMKSLKKKVIFCIFNIAIFLVAVYFFFRHNMYCEPGVYTWYSFCEYLTVFSNIAFHYTASLDFQSELSLQPIKRRQD